jgi:hypothetical protein
MRRSIDIPPSRIGELSRSLKRKTKKRQLCKCPRVFCTVGCYRLMYLQFRFNFNVVLKVIRGNKRERSASRQIGSRPLVPERITRCSQQGRKSRYFFITRALQKKKAGLKLRAKQRKYNVSLSCMKLEYQQMCRRSSPWPNAVYPTGTFQYPMCSFYTLLSQPRFFVLYVCVFNLWTHGKNMWSNKSVTTVIAQYPRLHSHYGGSTIRTSVF